MSLLRLDPRFVELSCALAQDQVLGLETVPDMARRHGAVAAVNAGFFLPTGDPAGLMKLAGSLVSETTMSRGAVAITRTRPGRPQQLLFDQVAVTLDLAVVTSEGAPTVRVDGVDTARAPGRLIWFTPHFGAHTDTSTAGTDWILRGSPPTVVERRESALRTVVPEDGAVLSWYGGDAPPAPLDQLSQGDRVRLAVSDKTARGTAPDAWAAAQDIVGGAGLLVSRGKPVRDWAVEKLRAGFATERHPRTMIGADADRRVWLITVDGRNPLLSLGMSFAELQGLARGLRLREALNLDGGGSTTMVVNGAVVNHPSDATGPRKVSDAIEVFRKVLD